MPNYEDPDYWDNLIDEHGNIRDQALEDLDREQLIERVKELAEILETLPDKIRSQESGAFHWFYRIAIRTGLNMAAEAVEEEVKKI